MVRDWLRSCLEVLALKAYMSLSRLLLRCVVGARMYRNENAKTVEAEVELALYLAGALSKDNFGNLRKVSWSRSGRTDKGVHAAAQVICCRTESCSNVFFVSTPVTMCDQSTHVPRQQDNKADTTRQ